MMKTVYIAKAQGVSSDDPTESLTLVFDQETRGTYGQMSNDALALSDALWAVLPGGTIDALLCELMRRRSSMLVVGFRDDRAQDGQVPR